MNQPDGTQELSTEDKIAVAMQSVHGGVGLNLRGQHPVAHAVLRASLQVLEVPAELRVGLFAAPAGYGAIVRLSNGGQRDDRLPDARGMAVKVLFPAATSDGPRQDFVLASSRVFFARNDADFLRFLAAKKRHALQALRAGLDFSDPLAVRPVSDPAGTRRQLMQQQFAELCAPDQFPALRQFLTAGSHNLLCTEYHSQTPYRLGDRVVKYVLQPVGDGQELPAAEGPAGYRQAIRALFAAGRSATFTLGVILQTNEQEMPVEDATVPWLGPVIPVATLTIAPQDLEQTALEVGGEQLEFSPWSTLPEHAPVGSLNEARKLAYLDSARTRHKNAQTVRRFFGCLAAGDYSGMQSCLHETVHFKDIGFDLHGREAVGLMWQMLCLRDGGIRVSVRDVRADATTGTASWECQYDFQSEEHGTLRPVHNRIRSEFRFCPDTGLIVEQRDSCDFWNWFEQAMGPKSQGLKFLDWLEDKTVAVVHVEDAVRRKVRATAIQKMRAVLEKH